MPSVSAISTCPPRPSAYGARCRPKTKHFPRKQMTAISRNEIARRRPVDLRGPGRNTVPMAVISLEKAEPRRRKPDSLARLKSAARKLFVERGYHATRPQDIAREAGLGHGTFYLHYPDKRACFLAFVEEARQELNEYLSNARNPEGTLEERVAATLNAI